MLRLPILLVLPLLLAACATNEGPRRNVLGFTAPAVTPVKAMPRHKARRHRVNRHKAGKGRAARQRAPAARPAPAQRPPVTGTATGTAGPIAAPAPAQRRCWWVPRRDRDPATRNRRERICDWWRRHR